MELVELTKKLVGFNTVSQESSTKDIADFISNYCESVGFKVEQYPYQNQRLEKINLIARKGGQESELALSGHMDTVRFDPSQWHSDPITLTLKGDKYVGMGVADMKLFLAIAIKAGEQISEAQLNKPFALCFTSDEEVGCLGVRKLMREGVFVAHSIIIGEPTEWIPIYLHKGYIYASVELKGKRGHSSDPRQGKSVIDLALVPVLNRLAEFKRRLESIVDARFNPPFPTMNIGVITTGEGAAKNIIPDYCRLEFDIRPIPGQDIEEMFTVLTQTISHCIDDIDGIQASMRYNRAPTVAMETAKNAPVVQLTEQLSGREAQSVCFNTEGGVFNASGSQSVIWGPASISQAHKPNEFAHIRWFQQKIVDTYIELIRRMCC